MLFAHISDFHVFAGKPESTLVRKDFRDVYPKIIEDINTFIPKIDAVMLTGDVTDGGTAEDYALLKEIMAPLSVPYFPIPGNHDRRKGFREAFEKDLPLEDKRYLHYEVIFKDTRILALDTMIEGKPAGSLCSTRLNWIRRKLKKPFDGPTLILMHHPPYISNLHFFDKIGLIRGRDEFAEIIRNYAGGSLRILSGHIHRPSMTCWNGVFSMIAGSPSFTAALDLRPHDAEPPTVADPYVYFIHSSDDKNEFVVHPRPLAL